MTHQLPLFEGLSCTAADDPEASQILNTKPPDVDALIADGAIFYVSHSGGKDSQAMYALLSRRIPHAQLVVHADLGRVEWSGVQDHIRSTISHPLNVVRANKGLLDMVRHRHATRPHVPSWPSSATRQCTSDLKRNPIQRFIRQDMKRRGATLAVNCVGLRAQESTARAKRTEWGINRELSRAGRTVWNWNVVHPLTTKQVFDAIRAVNQAPFWVYATGNQRLSCVFCIMGSSGDLANGRRLRPELYDEYLQIEAETGWTMFNGASLAERADLPPTHGRNHDAKDPHRGPHLTLYPVPMGTASRRGYGPPRCINHLLP